jgi:ceramide glucosyltransferase
MVVITALLLALLLGSLVYCVLTVLAARSYLSIRPPELRTPLPISVLKPLSGLDEGLEENLRSFFEQEYPEFEILFAVHRADDPAAAVVEKLRREFPRKPSARLIVTGEPPGPNAKVFSLQHMMAEARHDLLVMSDSDVRATPQMLERIACEFQDQRIGLVTCPYRAVPGQSVWSRLEAIGMNTEFLGGVLVARMLEGMKFALGPTIAARREVLERMGGFDHLKDYLAEDFVMGKLAAEMGYVVLLSSYVIEHRIGSQKLGTNLRHRLRWARSTRRSRPLGYWGQAFTNPLPLALFLWALEAWAWPLVLLTVMFRAVAAWAVAGWVLSDPLTHRQWWLVPLQDVVSFCVWVAGFFGNTILWRGRRCYVSPDGRFKLVS